MNKHRSRRWEQGVQDSRSPNPFRFIPRLPFVILVAGALAMSPALGEFARGADADLPFAGAQSSDASSLFNVSTRGRVREGASVMIGGFVIRGEVSKRVLLRARSPAVADAMADPTLRLYSGALEIGFNDNWQDSQEAEIIATGRHTALQPNDAALLATLAPGPYTVHVRDASDQTGIALFEVIGIDEEPDTRLFNLSTRAKVETGADVAIGGFVIRGDAPKQVLIRGRGPTVGGLSPGAELVDPTLLLYKDGIVIADNDDWNAGHQAGAIAATRRAPRNEAGTKEAAILATLEPGPYSAHLRGAALGTGIGIVEIIAVDEDVNEPEVFETFSDPVLSAERWRDREFRRVPGSLLIEQRLSGETASAGNNSALIDDPASVDSISVPVTVELAEVIDPVNDDGAVRARVGGFWYNDGTGGPGQTGDILAEVVLTKTGAQALQADALVVRCSNADCTTFTLLFSDPGFAPVQVGEEHQLHVEWDGIQFTFEIDGLTTSHTPGGTIAAAEVPLRWLGTRVTNLGTADEEGHIRARFGSVSVNGVLYDDFESVRLDPERWLLWDFERGITNGAFQSRIATYDGVPQTSNLRMRDPADVVAMRADLTIVSMANDGMTPRARVGGYWYHTGLAGPGDTGELYGEIAVVRTGGQNRFRGHLFRCEDANCVAGTVIFSDSDSLGVAQPGVPYAVGIEWDGTQFTFTVGDEEVTHEPTGIGALAGPSSNPLRLIGTTLRGSSGDGSVHAVFDNVDVDRAP